MSVEPIPAGSVEIREYLTVLRRQRVLILLVAVTLTAAAAIYSFQITPVYTASASVLVEPITTNRFEPTVKPDQLLNMKNEQQLVTSESVAALAAKQLGSTASSAELLSHVAVQVPTESQILRISYSDTVPKTAQQGANEFARAYLKFRKEDTRRQAEASIAALDKELEKLRPQVATLNARANDTNASQSARDAARASATRLGQSLQSVEQARADLVPLLDADPGKVLQSAAVPVQPSSPRHWLNIGLGLFIGLFLGTMLGFVRDHTDNRLRGRADLAQLLDRPVLAEIPRFPRWQRRKGRLGWKRRDNDVGLIIVDQPDSPAVEAYRALSTRVARLARQLEIQSIIVVSAVAGEGKSTTAANLAVTLGQTGRKVLLVSADLRQPRIHRFFSLPNKSGLSNLLVEGMATRSERPEGSQMTAQLWSLAPEVWAILSGPPVPHPSALLESDAMRDLLKEQRDLFDLVILDCPPALVVADALGLAPLVDAVLVVADAKASEREAVHRLRDELEQADGKIIGAVLNRSPERATGYYYRADSGGE